MTDGMLLREFLSEPDLASYRYTGTSGPLPRCPAARAAQRSLFLSQSLFPLGAGCLTHQFLFVFETGFHS